MSNLDLGVNRNSKRIESNERITINNFCNNQITILENNSIHNSAVKAGVTTIQNSLVSTYLSNLFSNFSSSTINQFFHHLRQYWSNLFSGRVTDTKFYKLHRKIYYHISIKSQSSEMSFADIDLPWKTIKDIFEISRNHLDEKIRSELPYASNEGFEVFRCRYDGSDFELRLNLISFDKFLYDHSKNSLSCNIMFALVAYAVKIIAKTLNISVPTKQPYRNHYFIFYLLLL